MCKSLAPCSRQTTTPAPHHSIFTDRMLFLTVSEELKASRTEYVLNSLNENPQLVRRVASWHVPLVKVLRPTRHKIGHFGDVPQAHLLVWYGKKTKPNTIKPCDGCPAENRWRPLQKFRNSILCIMLQIFPDARCWSAVQ